MPLQDAALLLLGHGSTLNSDSSAPTYQHAEALRQRGIFAEVHVGFWKEEPNFRQALRQTRRRQVYVVPNFISSGYFTEEVIPRELGLTGPVTRCGEQEIFYCEPVGLHRDMTDALLRRANEIIAASGDPLLNPAQTACLFICGHGTSLNDNSTKIIHEQAQIIRARGLFADCQPVLMEQRPFVKDWRTLTDCPDVIVVPFFISDGLHSFEDIPVLLGLTHNVREQAFANPHREESRRLWYATAIGTEPSVADLIVAQVRQFEAQHGDKFESTGAVSAGTPITDALSAFLHATPSPWLIGELAIRLAGGAYQITHRDDLASNPSSLRAIASLPDVRRLIVQNGQSQFRPLRAAPDLRRGWIMLVPDVAGLHLGLDYLYPAELANWALWKEGALAMTSWRETTERQTGRFRIVREIDNGAVRRMMASVCDPGCLKKRLWSPATQPLSPAASEIPLLCPEACNYLVSVARDKLKPPAEAEN